MSEGEAAKTFREHYAASQFRLSTWNQLKDETDRLRRRTDTGRDVADLEASIAAHPALLTRIERYWAFPGTALCAERATLFNRNNYGALQRQTARTLRLLVSGGFRRRNLSQLRTLGEGDLPASAAAEDEAALVEGEFTGEDHLHIEVLVVDEIGTTTSTRCGPRWRPCGRTRRLHPRLGGGAQLRRRHHRRALQPQHPEPRDPLPVSRGGQLAHPRAAALRGHGVAAADRARGPRPQRRPGRGLPRPAP